MRRPFRILSGLCAVLLLAGGASLNPLFAQEFPECDGSIHACFRDADLGGNFFFEDRDGDLLAASFAENPPLDFLRESPNGELFLHFGDQEVYFLACRAGTPDCPILTCLEEGIPCRPGPRGRESAAGLLAGAGRIQANANVVPAGPGNYQVRCPATVTMTADLADVVSGEEFHLNGVLIIAGQRLIGCQLSVSEIKIQPR